MYREDELDDQMECANCQGKKLCDYHEGEKQDQEVDQYREDLREREQETK